MACVVPSATCGRDGFGQKQGKGHENSDFSIPSGSGGGGGVAAKKGKRGTDPIDLMRILTHKMLRAFLWCIITVFFIAAVNALGKVVGFWDDCETAVVRLPVELTEVITNPFWEETLLEFASASEKWEVVRQATHYEISRKGSGKLWADSEQDKCCHVVVNVFDEPRQRVSKTNWNEFREMTIPVQRFREVPSAAILSSWEVCCSFPVVSWESELCIPIGVRSEVVCRERSNCPERCLTEPALEEVLIFLRLEPRDRLLTKNKEEKVDSP